MAHLCAVALALQATRKVQKQPRSPASTISAPVATMSRTLSDTIRMEISGDCTQNVPPKPQQISDPPSR